MGYLPTLLVNWFEYRFIDSAYLEVEPMKAIRISEQFPPANVSVLLGRHGSGWYIGSYSPTPYDNGSNYCIDLMPHIYINNIDCWCPLPEKPEGLI